MEFLFLIPTAILGFLLWQEKRDRALEREATSRERSELLNRIQAPEAVPTLAAVDPSEEPLYVPLDDDNAYGDYAERRAAGEVS